MDEPAVASTLRARQVTVDARGDGQRLDNYLLREIRGVPKSRLYRALRKGEIRVNGGRAQPGRRLAAGDRLRLPPLHQAQRAAPALPFHWGARLAERIVHEDPELLVVDKPAGLAVHGGSGITLGLIECLRQLRPEERSLELVHRLDRDTSGLLLLARRPQTLRELHGLLRQDAVDKVYLALVAGRWPRALTEVEAPLEKRALASGERTVQVSEAGRSALTRFRVRARFAEATLLEVRPVTGRTHQIRVHARHAGHPLLGDVKYQGPREQRLAAQLGLRRLFLHAWRLGFTLGAPGRRRAFEAPLDGELRQILEKLSK